jgi:phosphohistidine phosphatase
MASNSKKPSELLKDWPGAQIDHSGTFKYVLIEAYATDPDKPEVEHSKYLVRGTVSAEYHVDAYDPEDELLRKKGLDGQCIGGGRILHDPSKKYIKVYGYSQGFGKADHTKTVSVLKEKYPDYTIEWSNEGY